MRVSDMNYSGHEMARINRLLETIEHNPVSMAVVDYRGKRDADGPVTYQSSLDRRFGTRDLRHVDIYDLTVVRLNARAREKHPDVWT